VYFREGRYPTALPFIPGQEGAGLVTAVGSDVTQVKVGDRVAYTGALGSYAEYAAVPANTLVRIPDALNFRQAAAAMLQGMTAHYLSQSTYKPSRGDVALVHAAAGGVGLLLVQMLKRIGVRVIATVGSSDKAKLAEGAGADDLINYSEQDFAEETRRLTDSEGVHVVYDGVGRDTWEKDLDILRPRGMLVLYGGASGPVPPIEPMRLSRKGSLFLTRPTLAHYTATRAELEHRAGDVLGMIARGELKLRIEHEYPLADASEAHRDLEQRRTSGKLLLSPQRGTPV